MRFYREKTSISALPLAAASAVVLGAGAALAGSAPVTVTGPSPFASCDIAGEEGTSYLNATVEPWLDVNPSNPNRMVAGWQQDRWSNGGSRSLLSAYSVDGGKRWTRVVVPGINKCSGGKNDFAYDRSSDPWVAVAPDGTSYFMSLSFKNDLPNNGGSGANAMMVSRSKDGGATWGAPTALITDRDPHFFNDKNSMTADPKDSRYVYAVWDRLYDALLPSADGDAASLSAEPEAGRDGVLIARKHLRALTAAKRSAAPVDEVVSFKGPAYLARTTDGGETWKEAQEIHDPGGNAQTIANQAVVLNDGSVLVFFTEISSSGETAIRFVRSGDHGGTFDPAKDAVVTNVTSDGTRTPDTQESVRDANILFDVAIDRQTGKLYLVWQDGRKDGVDRVAFSMSTNNGASWTVPVIISKTPKNINPLRTQAFVPSVEVGAGSQIYVTYYDFRNDKLGTASKELADYWVISCKSAGTGCRKSAAWGNEKRLTRVSFDMLNAPIARGYFLGDYQGLVKQGNSVRALFGVATKPNETSMLTTLVR